MQGTQHRQYERQRAAVVVRPQHCYQCRAHALQLPPAQKGCNNTLCAAACPRASTCSSTRAHDWLATAQRHSQTSAGRTPLTTALTANFAVNTEASSSRHTSRCTRLPCPCARLTRERGRRADSRRRGLGTDRPVWTQRTQHNTRGEEAGARMRWWWMREDKEEVLSEWCLGPETAE